MKFDRESDSHCILCEVHRLRRHGEASDDGVCTHVHLHERVFTAMLLEHAEGTVLTSLVSTRPCYQASETGMSPASAARAARRAPVVLEQNVPWT